MSWQRSVELLLVHCEGEIGRVVLSGAPPVPGESVLERMNHLNQVDDRLRRVLTHEPRGFAQMSTNLLTPPATPGADAGFIVLQGDRAHAMSGSNCICVVTALIESGRIAAPDGEVTVRLDTPAGLVVARAEVEGGACRSVSLDNVPAFVEALDVEVETAEWGTIKVDIAFGGVFYALVDVGQLGMAIEPAQARRLAEAGMQLKAKVAAQMEVRHPLLPGIDQIAYLMFRSTDRDGAMRTCTVLSSRIDRSPCGTGSSANLATLHARGLVQPGDVRFARSIIGGTFRVEALGETEVAGRLAILPRISGRGWVYGRETLRLDADDPFPDGFTLADAWGEL